MQLEAKSEVAEPIHCNYSVFAADALHYAITLTLTVDLESLWYIKRHVIKFCMKFERNRAIPAELLIILRIFAHVMTRCDLDLCPLDLELLQHFGCHAIKFFTKYE